MAVMHELSLGLVAAIRERRTDDAIQMAKAIIDEDDHGAVGALLDMATVANLLHKSPGSPLGLMAAMTAAQENGYELTGDNLTSGDVAMELLDVIEDMVASESPSEGSEAILARFDLRPGNAETMKVACHISSLLLNSMALQQAAGLHKRRSAEAAQRFSLASARAAFRQEPLPELFSTEWDDEPPPSAQVPQQT